MAQFDYYRNPPREDFLLDIQSDLLDVLRSRVVVPLISIARFSRPIRNLNPVFTIEGEQFVMVTEFVGAVPASELRELKGSLDHCRDDIIRAIDMLLNGV